MAVGVVVGFQASQGMTAQVVRGEMAIGARMCGWQGVIDGVSQSTFDDVSEGGWAEDGFCVGIGNGVEELRSEGLIENE